MSSTYDDIEKFAYEVYNMRFNSWQIQTLLSILESPHKVLTINEDRRQCGKSQLLKILAFYYSSKLNDNTAIISHTDAQKHYIQSLNPPGIAKIKIKVNVSYITKENIMNGWLHGTLFGLIVLDECNIPQLHSLAQHADRILAINATTSTSGRHVLYNNFYNNTFNTCIVCKSNPATPNYNKCYGCLQLLQLLAQPKSSP
jgi:hypothetical protein